MKNNLEILSRKKIQQNKFSKVLTKKATALTRFVENSCRYDKFSQNEYYDLIYINNLYNLIEKLYDDFSFTNINIMEAPEILKGYITPLFDNEQPQAGQYGIIGRYQYNKTTIRSICSVIHLNNNMTLYESIYDFFEKRLIEHFLKHSNPIINIDNKIMYNAINSKIYDINLTNKFNDINIKILTNKCNKIDKSNIIGPKNNIE